MRFDRVLVTGGAGFIGSHTVDALLGEGASVFVLDNLTTGTLRNLRAWRENRKFHFRKGSTLHSKAVQSLVRRVDAVVHLAAIVSPYYSVERPEIVNEANVTGTLNVLNAAREARIQRIVFASSSSVYGEQTSLPISEDNPLHPLTPYGVSKLAGETYCGAYTQTYGLSTISLRYFNVYGPRQSANPYSGVIAIFSKQLYQGVRPTIYGDGSQTRDFVHVSDVVQANMHALNATSGSGLAFNVGRGKSTTINELSSLIAKLANKPDITPVYVAARVGDIRDSYADVSKAKALLQFEAQVELEQGLSRLLAAAP